MIKIPATPEGLPAIRALTRQAWRQRDADLGLDQYQEADGPSRRGAAYAVGGPDVCLGGHFFQCHESTPLDKLLDEKVNPAAP